MTEYVYLGRDNPISFVLKENSVALNSTEMSLISNVKIQYKGAYYTQASYPASFDTASYATQGKVVAYLGTIGLPVGRDYQSELIIVGSGYPDGIIWDTIDIEVIDETDVDPDLVAETGTASLASANSYIDLNYFITYCNNRGYVLTESTPVKKKQAIFRAMTFIECRPWKGLKSAQANPCEWPRTNVYDKSDYLVSSTTVPANVLKAQAEAAFKEHESLGILDLNLEVSGSMKSKKVGPLETEWFEGSRPRTVYPIFNRLLSGLIVDSSSVDLVRC